MNVCLRMFCNSFFFPSLPLGTPLANYGGAFPQKSAAMPQCHGLVRTLPVCGLILWLVLSTAPR